MSTSKKNLIIYASLSGNTKKVAEKIAETFERHGWENTLVQIDQNYRNIGSIPDFDAFDFICVGSGVFWHIPFDPLLSIIRSATHRTSYGKIVSGPRLGLAFATYGGAHLGPKEALATLELLEIAFEHLGFQSFGRLAVPGRVSHYHGNNQQTPSWYFPDIHLRPTADDLVMVERYVNDMLSRDQFQNVYGSA